MQRSHNNEETTIGEYLSEQIYLIPMVLGALGSFVVWLMHFLNPAKQHQNASVMLELMNIRKSAKTIVKHDEMTALKAHLDEMFTHFKQRIDKNEVSDDVAIPLLESFEQLEELVEKRVAKLAKA